jgi:hypothetical protein
VKQGMLLLAAGIAAAAVLRREYPAMKRYANCRRM